MLAGELIDLLDPRPGQTAIDCTFGGGGHAQLIAERLGAEGTLIAIDRDPLARGALRGAGRGGRLLGALHPRAAMPRRCELLREEGLRADTVYFDLGMSSMQVDTRERGFSYSYEAPLDMRMDPDQELSAREIVAGWDERRLARALRDFGEERHAGAIARAIVRRREQAPIETTLELVETINSAIPAPARFAGGHPAKRTFQALRIAVNDELGQLDRALPLAWELLREGGVLAGISFHSLEDRRVKRFLAERARGCICPPDLPVCGCGREPEAALLARRAIVPSAGEIARNPRSSSAALRAARKLTSEERRGMTPAGRRAPSAASGAPVRDAPPLPVRGRPRVSAASTAAAMTPPSALPPRAAPAFIPPRAPAPRHAAPSAPGRPSRPAPACRAASSDRRWSDPPAARSPDPRTPVDRGGRVRVDRDRDDATRAAEAERGYRARARARGALQRENATLSVENSEVAAGDTRRARRPRAWAWSWSRRARCASSSAHGVSRREIAQGRRAR